MRISDWSSDVCSSDLGHVGNQHVAGLHRVHILERTHHAGHAAADLLADRAAFGHHFAALRQVVALDLGGVAARHHRLRARLQDVELAGGAVLAPFDVHRAPRSEEHTSELTSLMRTSYAVFSLKRKKK